MKFRCAARARKFRIKFCEILVWGKQVRHRAGLAQHFFHRDEWLLRGVCYFSKRTGASQWPPTLMPHATLSPMTVRHRCGSICCVPSERSQFIAPSRVGPSCTGRARIARDPSPSVGAATVIERAMFVSILTIISVRETCEKSLSAVYRRAYTHDFYHQYAVRCASTPPSEASPTAPSKRRATERLLPKRPPPMPCGLCRGQRLRVQAAASVRQKPFDV